MSCDVGEVTERLENSRTHSSSLSNLSITSPMSELILQPFRRLTYVIAHSPTLPLLHLRHSSFSIPSFASPTSQALHLIHLASRPCTKLRRMWKWDLQLYMDSEPRYGSDIITVGKQRWQHSNITTDDGLKTCRNRSYNRFNIKK